MTDTGAILISSTRLHGNVPLEEFLPWFLDFGTSIPYLFDHILQLDKIEGNSARPVYREHCYNIMGGKSTHRVELNASDHIYQFTVDHPILKNTMTFQFNVVEEDQFDLLFTVESRRHWLFAYPIKILMAPLLRSRSGKLADRFQSALNSQPDT